MEVANLYDNGPISPVARIKDNIAVLTTEGWVPYQIEFIEGIPESSPYVVDMCFQNNLFTILPAGPGGQIAKQVVQLLQMTENEVCHYRWEPLDDVEGGLWELGTLNRYAPRGGAARVSVFTRERDPWLATTTFFILGAKGNRDVNIGAFNPWPIAQPTARFAFWGYRYKLNGPLKAMPAVVTYIPAQGIQ